MFQFDKKKRKKKEKEKAKSTICVVCLVGSIILVFLYVGIERWWLLVNIGQLKEALPYYEKVMDKLAFQVIFWKEWKLVVYTILASCHWKKKEKENAHLYRVCVYTNDVN